AKCRRYRHCHLRAGSEADMGRDRMLDHEMMAGLDAKVTGERFEMTRGAVAIRPLDCRSISQREADKRFRLVQRQTQATKAPTGAAIQVKKPEMEPGRHRRGHTIRHLLHFGCRMHQSV